MFTETSFFHVELSNLVVRCGWTDYRVAPNQISQAGAVLSGPKLSMKISQASLTYYCYYF